MKQRVSFVCQECGYDSPQWLGRCPECGAWNSLKEIRLAPASAKLGSASSGPAVRLVPKTIGEITPQKKARLSSTFAEMDGVLGGGIVQGSVILLAGDPGVGKSTLLLQIAINAATTGIKVLYISGEESEDQISLRAFRISPKLKDKNMLLLSTTDTDAAAAAIEEQKPGLVIIDSIQTMQSDSLGGLSGSVPQIRFATSQFIQRAKQLSIPVIIVGHVTKEGMVAGPMVLSHMVDTVLFLEGEKNLTTRILRSLKNRFGPVDEVGIFSMEQGGMQEVKDAQNMFLTQQKDTVPGSVLVLVVEGTRTFLVEIQSLVVYSKFPMPRRVATGVDSRRVELLLAVLQKHCRLPLETYDVFVNVAGGLRVTDPAVDIGICMAVFSSYNNISLPGVVGFAEVGLLGELRTVPLLDKRLKEARKIGFKKIFSASQYKSLEQVLNMFNTKKLAR